MTYRNFKEWFALAESSGCTLAQVVLQAEIELSGKSEKDIYTALKQRWLVMQASVEKALLTPQGMAPQLISGQAAAQHKYAAAQGFAGQTINLLLARALSASEVNAAMGRICAAPTAGACGVLPAVLLTATQQTGASWQRLAAALLVASGVGAIITRNATVAGAQGGCQAECGAAAAMAAAAAVCLKNDGPEMAGMVGNAVSIALMNCMGLVCDPVAGLVQLPCSFRNASQAVNAYISADMALAGQKAIIPPDEVVEAMLKVGKQLPPQLRETAQGGIAATPTAKKIAEELFEGNKT